MWSKIHKNGALNSMNKILRQTIAEILWLVVCIGLTILTGSLLFNWSFAEETIDIHLHDTMYVLNCWQILLPTFLLITFIVYFVKELLNNFRRNLPNVLLGIVGFALVISITLLTSAISQALVSGWTIYPPLTALGEDNPVVGHDPATKFILNFLAIVQMVVLFFLLFVIYRWGKQRSGVPKD